MLSHPDYIGEVSSVSAFGGSAKRLPVLAKKMGLEKQKTPLFWR